MTGFYFVLLFCSGFTFECDVWGFDVYYNVQNIQGCIFLGLKQLALGFTTNYAPNMLCEVWIFFIGNDVLIGLCHNDVGYKKMNYCFEFGF